LLDTSGVPREVVVHYPKVAIIGAGIGGVALAVACLHRGIPFTLYERDANFSSRSQGYSLTLQQANKAILGLGVSSLVGGINTTKHVVHNPAGKVIGEWGLRKWNKPQAENSTKRRNIHIARQTLRSVLLNQLGNTASVAWGHTLTKYSKGKNNSARLSFKVGDSIKIENVDLVVGADGIRSSVRKVLISENETPLQYLGCIVILGICSLRSLDTIRTSLLDSATVFQTVNGTERIYVMPYDRDSIMWQLSFPLPESEAIKLSAKGAEAMKAEACKRLPWHDPIPQMLANTPAAQITGYPVYDRKLLDPELLHDAGNATLIGDAAHPMSPFKGQGANQALLDALTLARIISVECVPESNWREKGLRETVLAKFEKEMLERSNAKVRGSEQAARLLHSAAVLHEGDEPRGRCLEENKWQENGVRNIKN
jgi:2-polyprenyl-6-methoxyphenol hydroxylase-like FAD-dependent oxidoreductase